MINISKNVDKGHQNYDAIIIRIVDEYL